MSDNVFGIRKYILALVAGVVCGGILFTLASRAIPRMMSGMMPGMMRNMMNRMGEESCNPAEM